MCILLVLPIGRTSLSFPYVFLYMFFFVLFFLHFPYKVQTDVNVYIKFKEQVNLVKIHHSDINSDLAVLWDCGIFRRPLIDSSTAHARLQLWRDCADAQLLWSPM